jgi:hypothetical protein
VLFARVYVTLFAKVYVEAIASFDTQLEPE